MESKEMYNFSSKLWINKRSISESGEATLYLQVVINGRHKELSLKIRWAVKFIDLLAGKLLPRHKNDEDVNAYNVVVAMELAKHNEINRAYLLRKENLDIPKFVSHLQNFDDKENFAAFMELERKRRFAKKEIDIITYNNVGACIKALLKYDTTPTFSKINLKWMQGFKTFLRHYQYKPDLKYKNSTIWALIKCTKTYLRIAKDEPLIFVEPKAYEFENPEPIAETEYLDREELRRLLILDNSGTLTDLQLRVLKAFLFQCYTGVRISDIYKANTKWTLTEDYLHFLPHKNRKNGKWLKIPLMGPAKSIIKNVTEGLFFALPNQAQYNETLKFLADAAKINKRLKSHMGRHTFGFLFMTSVGNLLALKELLGHAKIEATQRYSHINDEYKLNSVRAMAESFNEYKY
jgi:integrase/recombinase XerD